MLQMFGVMKSHNNITNYNILLIDVQYRQSESDGESHRTSFTMDPMEFFFSYRSRDKHTYVFHNVINANIITI